VLQQNLVLLFELIELKLSHLYGVLLFCNALHIESSVCSVVHPSHLYVVLLFCNALHIESSVCSVVHPSLCCTVIL